MTAPAAKKRRVLGEVKQAMDNASATPPWRAWVIKHGDAIAAAQLPAHVFASQSELSATLSCCAWSDPHPHAELVPLLDRDSTEADALRLLRLIDALKEIQPDSGGQTESYAREIMARYAPSPAPPPASAEILRVTNRDSALRQVALASYGSLYLRGALDLEKWYRHGLFWEARFQFRDPTTRRLIADDFTLWLGKLHEQGALRVSLHLAKSVTTQLPDSAALGVEWSDRMLIVHFANRHQCWALGDEQAQWHNEELHWDPLAASVVYPNAAYYAGVVDCYWLVEDAVGVPDIPETHWQSLYAAMRNDIGSSPHASKASAALPDYTPYCVYTRADEEWARLPVIPDSPQLALPHQLLNLLAEERGTFDNDTHTKNESSPYIGASEQFMAQLDHWSNRIDAWVAEVQLRAANEARWLGTTPAAIEPNAAFKRIVIPPAPPAALGAQSGDQQVDSATPYTSNQAVNADAATTSAASSRWTGRIAAVVAFAALTLFVIACAKIIVAWPWTAAPIALVLALVAKSRKA